MPRQEPQREPQREPHYNYRHPSVYLEVITWHSSVLYMHDKLSHPCPFLGSPWCQRKDVCLTVESTVLYNKYERRNHIVKIHIST